MKILFLDIDGVLNNHKTALIHGTNPDGSLNNQGYPHSFSEEDMKKFDHTAIGLIRLLCHQSSSKIVLSSSWRITFTALEVANGLFLPVIDKTSSLSSGIRGEEIQIWLDKNPTITKYAIVDDDTDMLPNQLNNFIHVDGIEGLSYKNYLQLLAILS